MIGELLRQGARPVNVGLRALAEAMRAGGLDVVHVDWVPPVESPASPAEIERTEP